MFLKLLISVFIIFSSVESFADPRIQTYDRNAAMAYHDRWYYDHNGSYYDYDNDGNDNTFDCTNYVSQILLAGGWKNTANPSVNKISKISEWFYVHNSGGNHEKDYSTRTWRSPALLYERFNRGYENVERYDGEKIKKLKRGDVVFLVNIGDGKNVVEHAMIVSGVLKNDITLGGHTSSRYRIPSNDIYMGDRVFVGFHIKDPAPIKKKVSFIGISDSGSSFSAISENLFFSLLGIGSSFAQQGKLFWYTSRKFTVKVYGDGFYGSERLLIDGSVCSDESTVSGDGYFTQECIAGDIAGNSNKITVIDNDYDQDIEVPSTYQYMELRGPVLAPLAPTLTDMGGNTVRVSWNSVASANGYELTRGGTSIATLGATTQYDDSGLSSGQSVCYRVRAISNGVASSYSAETCITLAAQKCNGTWNARTFSIGESEATTQSCPAGYSGSKKLSHICQAGAAGQMSGAWGSTTVQDDCSLDAPPTITCQGSWTSQKYAIGASESKTESCTGGQIGSILTSHSCLSNGSWAASSVNNSCSCPSGQVLMNGVCTTPAPTTCAGSWHSQNYPIGSVEDQYANSCPAGTVGQVRQFHTCQSGGIWSPVANSDNCTAVLVTPTGINISNVSNGVQLTWTAVSGATRYNISRNGDSTYSYVYSTSYVDPNAVNGGYYCYRVTSYSSYNNSTSPSSSDYCITYQSGQQAVNPPTNVAASQYFSNGRKGIRLTWNPSGSVDGYSVYRRDRTGVFAPLAGGDTSFIDWSELSLISGYSYCYFIRSVKSGIVSVESNDACSIAP